MKNLRILLLFPAILSSGAFAASLVNDFSTTAFTTETTNPQWTVAGGTYNNVASSGNTSASFILPGISGTGFTMSTQFTVSTSTTALTGGVSTVGFGVLGEDSVFTGGAETAYYLADFTYANGPGVFQGGQLRIIGQGEDVGATTTGTAQDPNAATNFAVQKGVTYTLKLTGTYTAGSLKMTLGLYDAAGTTQIGTQFGTLTDSTPLVGDNFGYRNRADASGSTNVSFDNFALQSVPEPASFALLLSAAALFAGRRKRA